MTELAKAVQQRDDAYRALREAGRAARKLRAEVIGQRDTVEGLAAALKTIQQQAAHPEGDPADVLHQISEDAGRVLLVAFVDAASKGTADAQP